MTLEIIAPRWQGRTVIVAATGPSLTPDVAALCRLPWVPVIAVNDAWRLLPSADVLYACDAAWWVKHTVDSFRGERWSNHDDGTNDKRAIATRYGLRLVAGRGGDTFSRDPAVIHYGSNSGFQAIGLAILFGARRIVLVGFDMQTVAGRRHFFGDHPPPLRNSMDYRSMVPIFHNAAKHLGSDVEIVNANPTSAITCWPRMTIDAALAPETTPPELAPA
jgi:hypothetical protein